MYNDSFQSVFSRDNPHGKSNSFYCILAYLIFIFYGTFYIIFMNKDYVKNTCQYPIHFDILNNISKMKICKLSIHESHFA